jgi:hypothetical protein
MIRMNHEYLDPETPAWGSWKEDPVAEMSWRQTCLDGTLVRRADGSWYWSDGTPEPRVTDMNPDEWNFRCRTYDGGTCYVEVLLGVAMESESLAWVVEGAQAGKYRSGCSGDHMGPFLNLLEIGYSLSARCNANNRRHRFVRRQNISCARPRPR